MTVNLGVRIPHRRNYAGVTTEDQDRQSPHIGGARNPWPVDLDPPAGEAMIKS